MRARTNNNENQKKLEFFRHSLLNIYPKKQVENIGAQEKIHLKNAILKIKYPYSLKNILNYINKETATLLATSLHPIVKEWGNFCNKFYADDPLNQYVEPDCGLVVVNRGGIWLCPTSWFTRGDPHFYGYGVWSVAKHCWEPAPGAVWTNTNPSYRTLEANFAASLLRYNPPLLFKYPMQLISPMHVAALLGDRELIEYLMVNGAALDDDKNKWQIMPVYFPIILECSTTINFMLEKGLAKNTALKCAVEHGSFSIIEELVNWGLPITDDVLDAALKRDKENRNSKLYAYLDLKRSMDVQNKIDQEGTYNALKTILNYSVIPIQSLIDLICMDPAIVHHIENELDGNTLLHQFVSTQDTVKVTALLEAFIQAGFKKIDGFSYDIETKNKHDKTILDLALAQNNNDLISAIIMHNPKISQTQQTQLIDAKIDIPAIHQAKEKRICNIMGQQSQRLEIQQHALEATIEELIAVKEEVSEIKQLNAQIVRHLEIQEKQMQMQQQLLDQVMQYLQIATNNNFNPTRPTPLQQVVIPNNELQQRMLPQADNINRLFALPQNRLAILGAGQQNAAGNEEHLRL